ncbi:MAG: hypothetical protein DRJ01_18035 [Bacteroidetes bacterium]|nr:MAG: hypothetical protein DRJ01_18035 [Bacteroidota bacterium]
MKKVTLILAMVLTIVLVSCENKNSNQNTTKDSQKAEEKSDNVKKNDISQEWKDILKKYNISLYPNMKIDKLKHNSDDGIIATYAIDDFSEERNKKVEKYLTDELLKLKNEGWGVMESHGIAQKKEGNYVVSIQISYSYNPEYKIHTLIYDFGKVY